MPDKPEYVRLAEEAKRACDAAREIHDRSERDLQGLLLVQRELTALREDPNCDPVAYLAKARDVEKRHKAWMQTSEWESKCLANEALAAAVDAFRKAYELPVSM